MTDGRLTIDAQSSGGGTLLVLEGEVDPHTTEQLDEAVDAALADAGDLVLELSGVTFIDSAGLRSLIRAQRQVDVKPGGHPPRPPGPPPRRVLETPGLTDELTVGSD